MNKLIEQFGNEKRWVNWTMKKVDNKTTKVPLGSSNKPETWSTYEKLKDKKNIGIMFGLDNTFLGIDTDHCMEDKSIVHPEADKISQLIMESETYCEYSPSGTGVHLYFKLSEPLELVAHKKEPFECYSSLRFFTVTGNALMDIPVRTINKTEALELLSIIGYPWGKDKKEIVQTNQEVNLSDDEVIKKMFSSKNGDKIKLLYNGDISDYKNDKSSADLALCNHLAFWTGKNFTQMERVWTGSPLGNREKTKARSDYRKRTIETAIANCIEVYNPVMVSINEDEKEEIDFDFLCTRKGKAIITTLCLENISKVLRLHPIFKNRIRYDTFKQFLEIKENDKWRQFEEKDILTIQSRISILFSDFQKVGKDMTYDAILTVAHENVIDSAIDYIKSLVWDGKPRLDTWLCSTYGAPETEYHKKVGSNWLKGLVKRIVHPGCKFDYVLVLEGEQGTKKSLSLSVLGADWHVETAMGTESKDFFMLFTSKAIIEFSEGETLSRTEVKRMKAVITTQIDRYRAPYERVTKDHPRRCVFAMTTNSSEYLKDETGNRRWLPVAMVFEEANVDWLRANREQLFAEAYQRVIINKETIYDFPVEETKEMQDVRRISDPNTERITDWYMFVLSNNERNAGITIYQTFMGAFNDNFQGNKMMKKLDEMSIANVLKLHLKLHKEQRMVNGIRIMRWYPPNLKEEDRVEPSHYISQTEKNYAKLGEEKDQLF